MFDCICEKLKLNTGHSDFILPWTPGGKSGLLMGCVEKVIHLLSDIVYFEGGAES